MQAASSTTHAYPRLFLGILAATLSVVPMAIAFSWFFGGGSYILLGLPLTLLFVIGYLLPLHIFVLDYPDRPLRYAAMGFLLPAGMFLGEAGPESLLGSVVVGTLGATVALVFRRVVRFGTSGQWFWHVVALAFCIITAYFSDAYNRHSIFAGRHAVEEDRHLDISVGEPRSDAVRKLQTRGFESMEDLRRNEADGAVVECWVSDRYFMKACITSKANVTTRIATIRWAQLQEPSSFRAERPRRDIPR